MNEVFPALRALVGRFDPTVFHAPAGRARIRLVVRDRLEAWDAVVVGGLLELEEAKSGTRADAVLKADAVVWRMIARDVRGGMDAFQAGRLAIRRNLHLGAGFLAATGRDEPGRLRFRSVGTRLGSVSILEAGEGDPVLLLHGLGATKAEFLPTVAALADNHRVIAMDLPGFGDTDKPFPAPYDPPFFASWAESVLDELEIERAHVLGHSMGGRVAIEFGLRNPDRTQGLILMTPSMAWLGNRRWANYLRLVRPELGILQPAPRPIVEGFVRRIVPGAAEEWTRAGIEEFLRAYLTPRGTGRLLRRRAPDLPGGPGRTGRVLDAARAARLRRPVHLGAARHARADRVPAPRADARCRTRAMRSSTAATCRSSSHRPRRTPPSRASCAVAAPRARSRRAAGRARSPARPAPVDPAVRAGR